VSFDDIDYSDYSQLRKAQQSMVREQWIQVKELGITREALEKCFETQQVNQLENCKYLAERYLDMLRTHRQKGFLAYQRNDPTK
jgi:hypothetical protein